ncbi:MAG: response regulator [Anaerolineaceae bacterium]|nr:response regulator [Anaerolineaceae bacterium]
MKICIVDDSTFARKQIRKHLEKKGYEVIEADSGMTALEITKDITPDCFTLDLLMPGLSGQETLAKLKPNFPDAHFIIVTADIQEETHKELIALGADAFLNKPVSEYDLISAIEQFSKTINS